MSFSVQVPVRFAHVDPAGIVFYPRYFELMNGAVEDWIADVSGSTFLDLHRDRRIGLPTVRLETDFVAPSRLGDLLDIAIAVERLGSSSCAVRYLISCRGEVRVRASGVLVCMDLDAARAVPWPDDLRAGLASVMTEPSPAEV